MKRIFYLFIFLGLMNVQSLAHEYYLSFCTIEYDSIREKIEMTFKFTTHDFEKSVSEYTGDTLNLLEDNQHPQADSLMLEYIKKYFFMEVNRFEPEYNILGHEAYLDETLWIYVEIEDVEELNSIHIINRLLFKEFPLQQNVVSLYINDKRIDGYKFKKLDAETTFRLE